MQKCILSFNTNLYAYSRVALISIIQPEKIEFITDRSLLILSALYCGSVQSLYGHTVTSVPLNEETGKYVLYQPATNVTPMEGVKGAVEGYAASSRTKEIYLQQHITSILIEINTLL